MKLTLEFDRLLDLKIIVAFYKMLTEGPKNPNWSMEDGDDFIGAWLLLEDIFSNLVGIYKYQDHNTYHICGAEIIEDGYIRRLEQMSTEDWPEIIEMYPDDGTG